jgi:hypothetical protein
MRTFSTFVWLLTLLAAPSNCFGQPTCRATVRANVEVSGSGLTLADLLAPGSCEGLRSAAAAVRLGAAPLAGSPRVLLGSQMREEMEAIVSGSQQHIGALILAKVPERITIRRAGARTSCAEIELRMFPEPPTLQKNNSAGKLGCGASNGVPHDAAVRQFGKAWDPATRSWIVTARCANARECVPFAVRVQPEAIAGSFHHADEISRPRPVGTALVHAGQPATLLWDQDGIRVVVPSVCLDSGAAGDRVRARLVHSNRILPAIVVNSGELKATS